MRGNGRGGADPAAVPNRMVCQVEFADRGAAFDPLQAAEPDLETDLAHRQAGGLGIHLVRQIMQDLEYRRAGGWNRLTMRRASQLKAQGKG